jgi:hypothetical protein
MPKETEIGIIKSSGETSRFSLDKLGNSLKHSGADDATIEHILHTVQDELYVGISTQEIYNRAYAMLKKSKPVFASKYKLKKAIYELGPTGFPFEKFVAAILEYSGHKTVVGKIMPGFCVNHEIDIFAEKNGTATIIECKFHGEEGLKCSVKVPLYIHSRYQDVKQQWEKTKRNTKPLGSGELVTNTRFTEDAMVYGTCVGLKLLSWDFPKGNGLKDKIDRLGLYPITVSTLLSNREKQFLLSRDVVLCRQLWKDTFYLDHLGITPNRKGKIINEISQLCSTFSNK